jgi:hypothetical protein
MLAIGPEPTASRATGLRWPPSQNSRPAQRLPLGNMRELGVRRLVASCLNDACRRVALIDVSGYPADTEVPSFRSRVVCAKCGSRGNKIDVRPNWKEQPTQPSLTGKVWR